MQHPMHAGEADAQAPGIAHSAHRSLPNTPTASPGLQRTLSPASAMALTVVATSAGIRRSQAATHTPAAPSSAARLHVGRPAAAAARRRWRAAAAGKEGGATQQAEGEQPRVPDSPPAPAGAGASSSATQQQQQQPSAASQLSQVGAAGRQ